ncbi:MAG TPA: metal-dependent hydrolase [Pseudonocardiaceae bacterium]|jgi:membrane-bound metal-dependent hydrolase YbcI (DUF457 family)|nr:metal-dependent hydrolase [Pseudonocardiaceae bacterium]
MMSSGHGGTGAFTGYTACLVTSAVTGHEWSWWFPHVAAVVVAGWALWCDCDTLISTVSTSLGWTSQFIHRRLIVPLCKGIYYATRTEADPADKPRVHRGATHTWPAAVVMGALVTVLCLAWPRAATTTVLAISAHWAMRGLTIPVAPHGKPKGNIAGRFITRRAYTFNRLIPQPGRAFNWLVRKGARLCGFSGKWVRTGSLIVCTGTSWLITENTPELRTDWAAALGVLVTIGILTHMLGDSVTESGICWKFPFIDAATGKRWQETKIPTITAPGWAPFIAGRVYKPAFKTGRWFELGIVYPVCAAGCVLAAPGGLSLVEHLAAWRGVGGVAAALPLATWQQTLIPTPPGAVATLPARSRRGAPTAGRSMAIPSRYPRRRPPARPASLAAAITRPPR